MHIRILILLHATFSWYTMSNSSWSKHGLVGVRKWHLCLQGQHYSSYTNSRVSGNCSALLSLQRHELHCDRSNNCSLSVSLRLRLEFTLGDPTQTPAGSHCICRDLWVWMVSQTGTFKRSANFSLWYFPRKWDMAKGENKYDKYFQCITLLILLKINIVWVCMIINKKQGKKSPWVSNPFNVMFAEIPLTDPFSCFSGIVPFYGQIGKTKHPYQLKKRICDLIKILSYKGCTSSICSLLPMLVHLMQQDYFFSGYCIGFYLCYFFKSWLFVSHDGPSLGFSGFFLKQVQKLEDFWILYVAWTGKTKYRNQMLK